MQGPTYTLTTCLCFRRLSSDEEARVFDSERDAQSISFAVLSNMTRGNASVPIQLAQRERKCADPTGTEGTQVCRYNWHRGNASVPIQLAQCWFSGLVISNAKL